MTKTFEEWAGMSTPPTEGLRIHTDKAFGIASIYARFLSSETRDLAAHIDIALREAFNAGRAAGIEDAADYCKKMEDESWVDGLPCFSDDIRDLNKKGK